MSVADHYLIGVKTHSMRIINTALLGVKDLRLGRYGSRGKPNTTDSLKGSSNKMIPNTILLDSYQCLAQPSSERLPPAADGSRYRDPQLDNVQRVRDLGTVGPTWAALSSLNSSPQ